MVLKTNQKVVGFRPSRELRGLFRKKCKELNLTQDEVLIELTSKWVSGKVKIPQEVWMRMEI